MGETTTEEEIMPPGDHKNPVAPLALSVVLAPAQIVEDEAEIDRGGGGKQSHRLLNGLGSNTPQ